MVRRLARMGLMGVLAASALLSGCGSLIDFAARENAAKIEADGRVRAAQITANAQNGNSYQSTQNYQNRFFTCEAVIDVDRDGRICEETEVFGKHKSEVRPGERVSFFANLVNCSGKRLSGEIYFKEDGTSKEDRNIPFETITINNNNYAFGWGYNLPKEGVTSGIWKMSWFTDGAYAGMSTVKIAGNSVSAIVGK